MRSFTDVHDELTGRRVPHEIVHLPSSSRTAQLAAEAPGVPAGDVVKSLLFVLDDSRPVLALVSGDVTVDGDALARGAGAAGPARREQGARELTGYRPGAVPPCGLATEMRVVADPGLFAPDVV